MSHDTIDENNYFTRTQTLTFLHYQWCNGNYDSNTEFITPFTRQIQIHSKYYKVHHWYLNLVHFFVLNCKNKTTIYNFVTKKIL